MIAKKSLRRWVNWWLRCVRRSGRARGFWSVVELRKRIYGAVVVKVSSGRIRGAVERVRGLRERQEARLAGVVIPGGGGGSRFHDRRARAGSKGRALRDFAALCLLAVSCGISRAVARTVTRNFEPAARKMTGVRWSHLMHPMNQVHKMSDS